MGDAQEQDVSEYTTTQLAGVRNVFRSYKAGAGVFPRDIARMVRNLLSCVADQDEDRLPKDWQHGDGRTDDGEWSPADADKLLANLNEMVQRVLGGSGALSSVDSVAQAFSLLDSYLTNSPWRPSGWRAQPEVKVTVTPKAKGEPESQPNNITALGRACWNFVKSGGALPDDDGVSTILSVGGPLLGYLYAQHKMGRSHTYTRGDYTVVVLPVLLDLIGAAIGQPRIDRLSGEPLDTARAGVSSQVLDTFGTLCAAYTRAEAQPEGTSDAARALLRSQVAKEGRRLLHYLKDNVVVRDGLDLWCVWLRAEAAESGLALSPVTQSAAAQPTAPAQPDTHQEPAPRVPSLSGLMVRNALALYGEMMGMSTNPGQFVEVVVQDDRVTVVPRVGPRVTYVRPTPTGTPDTPR